MKYIKTIPEKEVEIEFQNLTVDKIGNIKTVYTENGIVKSIKINAEILSDDSKQKYLDVIYDNILHQLNVDIKEFNFEDKQEAVE